MGYFRDYEYDGELNWNLLYQKLLNFSVKIFKKITINLDKNKITSKIKKNEKKQ